MTEEGAFQRKVLKWLEQNSIFAIKYNASGISKVGIPDVICSVNGYFVAIELKKEKGIVSDIQKYTLDIINKKSIGIVLRPSKFDTFKTLVLQFIWNDINYSQFKTKLLLEIGTK